MSTNIVYRYPKGWRQGIALITAVDAIVATVVLATGMTGPGLFVLISGLGGAWIFWLVSRTVALDDEGIEFRTPFLKPKSLGWNQIEEARVERSKLHSSYSQLTVRGRNVVIRFDGQIEGFDRIVEQVRQKRPDLFERAV